MLPCMSGLPPVPDATRYGTMGTAVRLAQASPEEAAMDQPPDVLNTAAVPNLAERCRTHLSPALQQLLHT